MIVWSVSQSAAWQCPRQWWLRHVAQAMPAQPDAPNRARGRAMHAAIERAYITAIGDPSRGGYMIKYIAAAAAVLWETWGYQQRADEYNTAVSQLSDLFLTLPVPAPHAILGIERQVSLTHTDEFGSYKINCVMDLVLRTGATSAHIRDWKSGRIEDDLSRNVQLAIYDLAARTAWPWLTTITVGLYSIRENRETPPVELDPRDRLVSLEQLLRDASDAHATLDEVRRGERSGAEAFPPVPGDRCASCVFRSYCPQFENAVLPLRAGVSAQDVAAQQRKLAHRLELVNR